MVNKKAIGHLLGSHVIVWDIEAGRSLYKLGFFGKPSGIRKPKSPNFDRPLELDLVEAFYLKKKGFLTIKEDENILSDEKFYKRAKQINDKFENQYIVYKDLRDKKYVVRPGLKFGTDFAIYNKGPGVDHSSFVVHILNTKIEPVDLVRAGRLATSVRKKYVIATILRKKDVKYYVFTWYKP